MYSTSNMVKLGLLTNGIWAEIMYSVFMDLRKAPFDISHPLFQGDHSMGIL